MDCELLMEVGFYCPQIVSDPKLPLDECSFGVTGTYDGTRQVPCLLCTSAMGSVL